MDHGWLNITEPMALGLLVLMGPPTYGIAFAAEPAARARAFESLLDAAELEARVGVLLSDQAAHDRMAEAARAFAATQTGAAERAVTGLKELLADAARAGG